jgi:hypothetical protein
MGTNDDISVSTMYGEVKCLPAKDVTFVDLRSGFNELVGALEVSKGAGYHERRVHILRGNIHVRSACNQPFDGLQSFTR